MRSSLSPLRAASLPILAFAACLAPPPAVSFLSTSGVVRAESREEAHSVAEHFAALGPAVVARLEDAALSSDLEVWMQDEPHLFHSALESSSDAEGLYAPGHSRILLSRKAPDLERVLAHELGHAALGDAWAPLTGTLEEGLCDVLASELVPEQAARLRAGRLSSAALACGGLSLGLEMRDTRPRNGAKMGWSAHITLTSEEETPADPLDLFRVRAGLSSTGVRASVKRGYYGLAFLVVERVGIDALFDLCERAEAEGFDHLPRAWVLRAADLDEDLRSWRRAAAEAMGEAELLELVRMYPGSVASAMACHLRRLSGTPEERWEAMEAEVWVGGGEARLDVSGLEFLKAEVLSRL